MPETNNNQNKNLQEIETAFFSSGWLSFIGIVNRILVFFSLRSQRKYWGVVYDSVSKQPLDPAIVKLVYVDNKKVSQTKVTDLKGRYGFLVHPGKFKILAKKTNYIFPSELVKGDTDGIYESLYHGEFFELKGGLEVLAPNIPMDPAGFDWNQKAKMKVSSASPNLRYLFRSLVYIFFWFGFVMSSVYFLKYFPANINSMLAGVIVIYLVLFFLTLVIPRARLWGKIIDKRPNPKDAEIQLELSNASLPGVVLGKTSLDTDSKFFLRANPGSYVLTIKEIDKDTGITVIGNMEVMVEDEGVFNRTIIVK